MKIVLRLRTVLQVFSVSPRTRLQGIKRSSVNTETWISVVRSELLDVRYVVLKDLDPSTLVLLQNVFQVVLLVRHTGQLELVGQVNLAVYVRVFVSARNNSHD